MLWKRLTLLAMPALMLAACSLWEKDEGEDRNPCNAVGCTEYETCEIVNDLARCVCQSGYMNDREGRCATSCDDVICVQEEVCQEQEPAVVCVEACGTTTCGAGEDCVAVNGRDRCLCQDGILPTEDGRCVDTCRSRGCPDGYACGGDGLCRYGCASYCADLYTCDMDSGHCLDPCATGLLGCQSGFACEWQGDSNLCLAPQPGFEAPDEVVMDVRLAGREAHGDALFAQLLAALDGEYSLRLELSPRGGGNDLLITVFRDGGGRYDNVTFYSGLTFDEFGRMITDTDDFQLKTQLGLSAHFRDTVFRLRPPLGATEDTRWEVRITGRLCLTENDPGTCLEFDWYDLKGEVGP